MMKTYLHLLLGISPTNMEHMPQTPLLARTALRDLGVSRQVLMFHLREAQYVPGLGLNTTR